MGITKLGTTVLGICAVFSVSCIEAFAWERKIDVERNRSGMPTNVVDGCGGRITSQYRGRALCGNVFYPDGKENSLGIKYGNGGGYTLATGEEVKVSEVNGNGVFIKTIAGYGMSAEYQYHVEVVEDDGETEYHLGSVTNCVFRIGDKRVLSRRFEQKKNEGALVGGEVLGQDWLLGNGTVLYAQKRKLSKYGRTLESTLGGGVHWRYSYRKAYRLGQAVRTKKEGEKLRDSKTYEYSWTRGSTLILGGLVGDDGYVLPKTAEDDRVRYSFDCFDHLISVEMVDKGFVYHYRYYPDGRLCMRTKVAKKAPETVLESRYYYYKGRQLIREVVKAASREDVQRDYLWGMDLGDIKDRSLDFVHRLGGIGGLVGVRVVCGGSERLYFAVHDLRGNIMAYMDGSTGLVVLEIEYDPFGAIVDESYASAPTGVDYTRDLAGTPRFSSKLYDAATGLYYFGKSYYCPVTLKWVVSPHRDEVFDTYYFNDPINKLSPYGR